MTAFMGFERMAGPERAAEGSVNLTADLFEFARQLTHSRLFLVEFLKEQFEAGKIGVMMVREAYEHPLAMKALLRFISETSDFSFRGLQRLPEAALMVVESDPESDFSRAMTKFEDLVFTEMKLFAATPMRQRPQDFNFQSPEIDVDLLVGVVAEGKITAGQAVTCLVDPHEYRIVLRRLNIGLSAA